MNCLKLSLVLACGFALVLAAPALAGDKSKKELKKGLLGTIEKVDAAAKTITVKTGKKKDATAETVTIPVNDETKYYLMTADGNKQAKLGDLLVGARVSIAKEKKDGQEVAAKVTVMEKKRKKG